MHLRALSLRHICREAAKWTCSNRPCTGSSLLSHNYPFISWHFTGLHTETHTHTHILALDSWLVSPSRSMCVPAERLDETLFFGSVIRLIILHCQPLLTFTQTGEPVQVSKQASKWGWRWGSFHTHKKHTNNVWKASQAKMKEQKEDAGVFTMTIKAILQLWPAAQCPTSLSGKFVQCQNGAASLGCSLVTMFITTGGLAGLQAQLVYKLCLYPLLWPLIRAAKNGTSSDNPHTHTHIHTFCDCFLSITLLSQCQINFL